MNTPIYVDTNVFMDFFEARDSAAYELIQKAIRCSYKFIISDQTMIELQRQGHFQALQNFLLLLLNKEKANIVVTTESDREKAARLAAEGKTHYADGIHISIAERIGATCIVTKNYADFVHATKLAVKRADIL